MTAYKFLKAGLRSQHDGSEWTVGKWRVEKKPRRPCVGLNASKYIQDALGYVQGPILAKVEYGGVVIDSGDKVTCEKMRLVKLWRWTEEMSVDLAVFAAEKVLPIFERKFPNDVRPRKAIEAIKSGVNHEALLDAAYATDAATDAADAAVNAGYAGYTANYAVTYAADVVADAAVNAGYAVVCAAYAVTSAVDAVAYATDAIYAAVDAGGESIKRALHRYALKLAKETEE